MANYKIVDADRLDADMTGLADVIRQRAGTAGKLEFPEEMKEAVRNIRGGVELPALDNPGTAGDLAKGKQLIGADGRVIEGSVTEHTPASRDLYKSVDYSDWVSEYDPEDNNYCLHRETSFENDALVRKGAAVSEYVWGNVLGNAKQEDVAQGVTFTSENGLKLEGTMEPNSGPDLPELDNPGTAGDLAKGKQLIGADGKLVTGTIEDGFMWHYHYDGSVSAYEEDGAICFDHAFDKDVLYRKGEHIILCHSDLGDALPQEVVKGRTFTTSKGVKIEGTMEPGSGGVQMHVDGETLVITGAVAVEKDTLIL